MPTELAEWELLGQLTAGPAGPAKLLRYEAYLLPPIISWANTAQIGKKKNSKSFLHLRRNKSTISKQHSSRPVWNLPRNDGLHGSGGAPPGGGWVWCVVVCRGVRWSWAPVGAPGDGGNKAYVGEQDGVVLDAVQGVVHLTQRQPVQLELQLHLQPSKHRQSLCETSTTHGDIWTGSPRQTLGEIPAIKHIFRQTLVFCLNSLQFVHLAYTHH